MHSRERAAPLAESLVVFVLDDQRYAVHLSAVYRVIAMVRITPLPQAPAIVLGAINIQGAIVPVINLRRRFGLPEREPRLTDRLLIARAGPRRVALVADAVPGL